MCLQLPSSLWQEVLGPFDVCRTSAVAVVAVVAVVVAGTVFFSSPGAAAFTCSVDR